MNTNGWKKFFGLVMLGLFPSLFALVAVWIVDGLVFVPNSFEANFFPLLIPFGVFLITLVGFYFVAVNLLRNPFSELVEGHGLLAFDLTSTGIINLFLIKMRNGNIVGKLNGVEVTDIFDRETVFTMKNPIIVKDVAEIDSNGDIKFKISTKEYNASKFQIYSYPTLIYNSQIGSLLTKEFLSTQEKATMIDHVLLRINKELPQLELTLRNFSRSVIDSMMSFMGGGSWLLWVLIGIVIVVLGVMFVPNLVSQSSGVASNVIPS